MKCRSERQRNREKGEGDRREIGEGKQGGDIHTNSG